MVKSNGSHGVKSAMSAGGTSRDAEREGGLRRGKRRAERIEELMPATADADGRLRDPGGLRISMRRAASSPAMTILSREAARDLLSTISCQWEAVGLVLRLHPRLCELQHVHSCERASQLGQLRQMRQSCAAFPPG